MPCYLFPDTRVRELRREFTTFLSKGTTRMPTLSVRSFALAVLFCLLPLKAAAQQPFFTDDADVTGKGKLHLQFADEYDILQRSLYPGKA